MERDFLTRFLLVATRFLLVTTRFLMVLTTRNEVKNHGGYQMEREFLTRFLVVTTRFLMVLTTRNEVKKHGGDIRAIERVVRTSMTR